MSTLVIVLAWLAVTYVILVAIAVVRFGWSDTVHNVVAHQLLSLFPPLGEWLHQHTEPADAVHWGPESNPAKALTRETWRLIAAETLDLQHLDELEAMNVANGHDEDSSYDQRLHEIILRRRRELTTLQRTAAVGGASPFASPCQRAEHWLGGSVGVGLHLGALGDPGACSR